MDSKLTILKDLIKGELVAEWQYEIAAESCIGNHQEYLVKQFEEHAEQEHEHYKKLMVALMARNGKPDLNLDDIISRALPVTNEMTSNLSDYLRKFFKEAEASAIEAYEDFLDIIKDTDQDLADIVSGIIAEERDHKLDMMRLEAEGNPNLVFSKSEEKSDNDLIREFAEKGLQTKKDFKRGTVRNPNAVLSGLISKLPGEVRSNPELMEKLKDAFKEAMD